MTDLVEQLKNLEMRIEKIEKAIDRISAFSHHKMENEK